MRHGILLSRRWRSCKSKKVAFNPFVWRYCGWKNNNEHGPVDPPVVPSSSYISLLQLACHTHVLLPLKIAWSLKNKIEIENGGSRKKQTEITQRRYNCPNGWNMGHSCLRFSTESSKKVRIFFCSFEMLKAFAASEHLTTCWPCGVVGANRKGHYPSSRYELNRASELKVQSNYFLKLHCLFSALIWIANYALILMTC